MVLLPLWQSAFRLFWISLGKVGFNLHGGEPFFTRGLKLEAKLTFYRANQLNVPSFLTLHRSIFIVLYVCIIGK